MTVYIIYRIGDYANPVAITLNRDAAAKYVQSYNKEQGWKQYFMERRLISNAVISIMNNEI